MHCEPDVLDEPEVEPEVEPDVEPDVEPEVEPEPEPDVEPEVEPDPLVVDAPHRFKMLGKQTFAPFHLRHVEKPAHAWPGCGIATRSLQ